MSITRKIGAVVSLLGMLLVVGEGYLVYNAYVRLEDESRSSGINVIVQSLVDAAGSLAAERGATNGVINNPAGSEQRSIDTALANRTQGMAHLDAALADLEALDLAGLEAPMARLTDILAAVDRHRAEVDEVFASRRVSGDSTLTTVWFGTATDLIMATAALRQAVEDALPETVSPAIWRAFAVRAALWQIAEFSGRQRGMMAGIIARGNAMTQGQLEVIYRNEGVIEAGWMAAVGRGERMSDAMADAVASALDAYAGEYHDLRVAVFQAGADGSAYPVSSADWFAAATAAIDAVRSAGRVVADEAAAMGSAANDASRSQLIESFMLIVGVLVIVVGAAWFARQSIARPIVKSARIMDELTQGNTEVEIAGTDRRDEIGAMARALTVLHQATMERDRLKAAQEMAERAAREERRSALRDMAAKIDTSARAALSSVGENADHLVDRSHELLEGANKVADDATAVSTASSQATANAQAVVAAAEELSASIREITRQVGQSTDIAETAVERAEATRSVVHRLDEVGAGIGDVVNLIRQIAEQTNLLALNATIEAARAGEAGRGFAVVAGEVKTLANQTARSTEEIAKRVDEIRSVSREAAEAIQVVASTIVDMNQITQSVSASVHEQETATENIARSVQHSTDATGRVAALIDNVHGEVGKARDSAGIVEETARSMAAELTAFRNAVVKLIHTSTSDADRRMHERFHVSVRVRLQHGGDWTDGTLVDCSNGGARLAPIPDVEVGTAISIEVPSVEAAWEGHVVNLTDAGVHVQFDRAQHIDDVAMARLERAA